MSRGGRSGGVGGGIRAIADSLGIQRQDMASYNVVINTKEPLPLFPALPRKPCPLPESDELHYLAELEQELTSRFHESPFYLEDASNGDDIKRYTDKYKAIEKETWLPDWNRIPVELCWLKKPKINDQTSAKRRKIDLESVATTLAKLEAREKDGATVVGSEDTNEEETEEQDEEEKKNVDEEAERSDDDYLEEGNDYIDNYFDNGEDYGEGRGSDDNLEDDGEVY